MKIFDKIEVTIPPTLYVENTNSTIKLQTKLKAYSELKFGDIVTVQNKFPAIFIGLSLNSFLSGEKAWFFSCYDYRFDAFEGEISPKKEMHINFFSDTKFSEFFCRILETTFTKLEKKKPSMIDFFKDIAPSSSLAHESQIDDKKTILELLENLKKNLDDCPAKTNYENTLVMLTAIATNESLKNFKEPQDYSNYSDSKFEDASKYQEFNL